METIYFARLLPVKCSGAYRLREVALRAKLFTPDVGWRFVSEADAEYLGRIASDQTDSISSPAFDVCRMNLPELAETEDGPELRYFARLNTVSMNEFRAWPFAGAVCPADDAWVRVTRSEGHVLSCIPSRLRDPTSPAAFEVRAERECELVEPLLSTLPPSVGALNLADASGARPLAADMPSNHGSSLEQAASPIYGEAAPQVGAAATSAMPSAQGSPQKVCSRSPVTHAKPMNLVLGVSVREAPNACRHGRFRPSA